MARPEMAACTAGVNCASATIEVVDDCGCLLSLAASLRAARVGGAGPHIACPTGSNCFMAQAALRALCNPEPCRTDTLAAHVAPDDACATGNCFVSRAALETPCDPNPCRTDTWAPPAASVDVCPGNCAATTAMDCVGPSRCRSQGAAEEVTCDPRCASDARAALAPWGFVPQPAVRQPCASGPCRTG